MSTFRAGIFFFASPWFLPWADPSPNGSPKGTPKGTPNRCQNGWGEGGVTGQLLPPNPSYSPPKCIDFNKESRGVFGSAPQKLLPPKSPISGPCWAPLATPFWSPFGVQKWSGPKGRFAGHRPIPLWAGTGFERNCFCRTPASW